MYVCVCVCVCVCVSVCVCVCTMFYYKEASPAAPPFILCICMYIHISIYTT